MKKSLPLRLSTLAAAISISVISTNAETYDWIGGDNNLFNNANNWDGKTDYPRKNTDIANFDSDSATDGEIHITENLSFDVLNQIKGDLTLDSGKRLTLFNYNGTGGNFNVSAGTQVTKAANKPGVTPTSAYTVFNGVNLNISGLGSVTQFLLPITSFRDISQVPNGQTPTWQNGAKWIPAGSVNFTGGNIYTRGIAYAGDMNFDNTIVLNLTDDFQFFQGNLTMTNSQLISEGKVTFFTDNGATGGEEDDVKNVMTLTNSYIRSDKNIYMAGNGTTATYILNNSTIQSTSTFHVGWGDPNSQTIITIDLNGTSALKKTTTEEKTYLYLGNGINTILDVNVRDNSYIAGNREIFIGSSDGPAAGSDVTVTLYDSGKIGNYGGMTGAWLRVGTRATMENKLVKTPNVGTLSMLGAKSEVSVLNAEVGYDGGTGYVDLSPGATFYTTGGGLQIGLQGGTGAMTSDGGTIQIQGGDIAIGRTRRDDQRAYGKLEMTNQANLYVSSHHSVRLGSNGGDGELYATDSIIHINNELQVGYADNREFNGEYGTAHVEFHGNTYVYTGGPTHVGINHSTGYLLLDGTASLQAKDMSVGYRKAGVGTLEIKDSAYVLIYEHAEISNEGGKGTLIMSGEQSKFDVRDVLTIGRNNGDAPDSSGVGTVIMSGSSTINVYNTVEVARDGKGAIGNITMSDNAKFNVHKSRILINAGHSGKTTLTLSGNSQFNLLNPDADNLFGRHENATSLVTNISDNAQLNIAGKLFLHYGSNTLNVGGSGDARVTIGKDLQVKDGPLSGKDATNINSGGTLTVGGQFRLGANNNLGINFTVNGGTVNANGTETIVSDYKCNSGDKKILNIINNGTFNAAGGFYVSRRGSQDGVLNVNTGGKLNINNDFIIGLNSDNLQNVNDDGENYTRGTVNLGTAKGKDSATVFAKNIIVGGLGSNGTVNIQGGATLTATEGFVISNGRNGTVNVADNATVKIPENLYIGGDGTLTPSRVNRTLNGTLAVSGGLVDASSGKIILGTGTGYTAGQQIYRTANNDLTLTPQYYNGSIPRYATWDHDNNSGTAEIVALTGNTVANGKVTLTGGIIKTQGFEKAANATSANIELNGGAIQLTGATNSLFTNFATGDITIGAKGVTIESDYAVKIDTGLVGTGNITKTGTGAVTISGNNTAWQGAVNVTAGSIAIENDTALLFILDLAKGDTSKTIDAENAYTGDITIGDAVLNVVLANFNEKPVGVYTYNVFTGANVTGSITIREVIDNTYSLAYRDGKIIVTVVPEPQTYALLSGIALLGMALVRRRKK